MVNVVVFCDAYLQQDGLIQSDLPQDPDEWYLAWKRKHYERGNLPLPDIQSPPLIDEFNFEWSRSHFGQLYIEFYSDRDVGQPEGIITQTQAKSIEESCGPIPTAKINNDIKRWMNDTRTDLADQSNFIVVPYSKDMEKAASAKNNFVEKRGDWLVVHNSHLSTWTKIKVVATIPYKMGRMFVRNIFN